MQTKRLSHQVTQENFKAFVAVFLLLTLIILGGYFLRENNKARQEKVVDSMDAGHLMNTTFISNTLSRDISKVETDQDTYLVYGKLEAEKGASFRLEKRLNRQRFLCEASRDECWKLVI